ncbi:homeodomain mating type protein alpha2 [Maudiozyma exigua]|uniref:Homeodomain mating type protein alpha2 n=1 Tax=Maudiozyma exigua TaxID=34358 RepID=A0A9P6VUC7_MAUEX|nr:homeodomain mating type protein alpha2 [Kazachstania exigua]KAG0659661.1 homeodomain mating type protein alpha2 [Kazachstania exigua]KAG0662733.1 homeodomain mating type protein alpha2 [Kazachstania exigua]
MNKIPIQHLLNPTSNKRFYKSDLKQINTELMYICSSLPEGIFQNIKDVKIHLHDIVTKLGIIKSQGKLDNEERYLIKISFQLATIVANFLRSVEEEKKPNKDSRKKKKQGKSSKEEQVVFNVVTQNMMNMDNVKHNSFRGHRFSKQNVDVLEEWYGIHKHKPYLDKKSIERLQSQTQLSRTQIKNWVSNKRRKEKTVQVSSEILQLINGK